MFISKERYEMMIDRIMMLESQQRGLLATVKGFRIDSAEDLAELEKRITERMNAALSPENLAIQSVLGMAKHSGVDETNWLGNGLSNLLTYDGKAQERKD